MADRVSLDVNGMPELLRKLEQRGVKTKAIMRPAVQAGGKVFEREQKRLARVRKPDDKQGPRPPGRMPLKQGIKSLLRKAKKNYVVNRIGPTKQVQHGFPLETGHKQSGRYRYARGTVPAYPFAEPSFQNKESEAYKATLSPLLRVALGPA